MLLCRGPIQPDGTARGMEPNSITFELCRQYVDDYCLVSEQAIQKAMCALISTQHLLIEGAAGVALSGLFKRAKEYKGKKVVVVLSGANISLPTLDKVIKHGD